MVNLYFKFFADPTCDETDSILVLKYLVDQNANLGAKSNYGWTILHFASENSDMEIAKYLIEEKKIGKWKEEIRQKEVRQSIA